MGRVEGGAAAVEGVRGGKTGTSQESRDAWFIGFTDDLVVGVWVGNDDNSPMDRVTGGGLPAGIFARLVRAAAAPDVPLAQTQLLGTGTVSGDTTTIPLQPMATPTNNLLVWITALGQSDDDQYKSQIAEVTVVGAS